VFDHDHDTTAVARQAVATVASGDRTEPLRGPDVPTLEIHGLADRMCDVTGGRATAAAIPGAELMLIDGMGHELPPGLRQRIADAIATSWDEARRDWHPRHEQRAASSGELRIGELADAPAG
jgi:pimeloyl-ACP methyl ester carboxylesterase